MHRRSLFRNIFPRLRTQGRFFSKRFSIKIKYSSKSSKNCHRQSASHLAGWPAGWLRAKSHTKGKSTGVYEFHELHWRSRGWTNLCVCVLERNDQCCPVNLHVLSLSIQHIVYMRVQYQRSRSTATATPAQSVVCARTQVNINSHNPKAMTHAQQFLVRVEVRMSVKIRGFVLRNYSSRELKIIFRYNNRCLGVLHNRIPFGRAISRRGQLSFHEYTRIPQS